MTEQELFEMLTTGEVAPKNPPKRQDTGLLEILAKALSEADKNSDKEEPRDHQVH